MAKKSLKNAIASPSDFPVKYTPTKEDVAREKRYMAEDDIRTLQRAEEIKKDKSRMSAVKQMAKSQVQNLKKIC